MAARGAALRVVREAEGGSAPGVRAAFARFARALGLLEPDDDLPPVEPPAATGRGGGAAEHSTALSPTLRLAPESEAYERARLSAYADYEDMDLQCPEFSRALDVVADLATSNDRGEPPYRLVFKPGLTSGDRNILEETTARLHLHELARPVCRDGEKLGDVFGELVPDSAGLLVDLQPRAAASMFRVEGSTGSCCGSSSASPGLRSRSSRPGRSSTCAGAADGARGMARACSAAGDSCSASSR